MDLIDDRSETIWEKSWIGLEVAVGRASRCGPAVVEFDEVVACVFHPAINETLSHVEDGLFGAGVAETADVVDAPCVDSEDGFAVEPSTIVVGKRTLGNDGDREENKKKKFHFLFVVEKEWLLFNDD